MCTHLTGLDKLLKPAATLAFSNEGKDRISFKVTGISTLILHYVLNPTAILKNLGSICRAISLIEPQHIVCIQVNDVVGLS
ncbi:hypothetical protein, partial [Candidatus Hakubella thermalkaliphila]|uniref:hypothetical protein n=1 Tax=Candidatus Hakubella thermalkaliphila TaxID=2754717 RepID=UPI001C61274F